MIEKTNIPIHNKQTKKIKYNLSLDFYDYYKTEFDSRGNQTYFEDSGGYWFKNEYDNEGKRIYFGYSRGYISDDR